MFGTGLVPTPTVSLQACHVLWHFLVEQLVIAVQGTVTQPLGDGLLIATALSSEDTNTHTPLV